MSCRCRIMAVRIDADVVSRRDMGFLILVWVERGRRVGWYIRALKII